jgi:hypothetical protein
MALLNENLSYQQVATPVSTAVFLGGAPEVKHVLPSGTRLFRFGRNPFPARPCEWWMLFDDIALPDQRIIYGFAAFLHHSGCRLDSNGYFIPQGDITLGCADPGTRFLMVQSNTPVYAFLGATTPQRPDPGEPGLPQKGGEFRVWIPGIEVRMLNHCPVPRQFVVDAPHPAWTAQTTVEPPADQTIDDRPDDTHPGGV